MGVHSGTRPKIRRSQELAGFEVVGLLALGGRDWLSTIIADALPIRRHRASAGDRPGGLSHIALTG